MSLTTVVEEYNQEAAQEQDRLNMQQQQLDALFSLWKQAFLTGPVENSSFYEASCLIASALGLLKEWEGMMDHYVFSPENHWVA